MGIRFAGKWRGMVTGRNSEADQRVVVSAAASGNGSYSGVVGNSFFFEDGEIEMQWKDPAGSGWHPSRTINSGATAGLLMVGTFLSADDGFPADADGDYDDLRLTVEYVDPPFEVVQRPFALERGSLMMLPDGIFDTSQGVQYMGVRIRNTWFFDWNWDEPIGVKIGIPPVARDALASQGIRVVDEWSVAEQRQLGQEMVDGYVKVPKLLVGEERVVYFKLDLSRAGPSKPDVGFVAQTTPTAASMYETPTRIVHKRIFISQSSYDKDTGELVAKVPEGTLRLKFTAINLDLKAANQAAKELTSCLRGQRGGGGAGPAGLARSLVGSWWENQADGRERDSRLLRRLLEELLAGKDVDPCEVQAVLERCRCEGEGDCDCPPGGGGGGGGWQEGTGMDGWCRVRPVAWLPVAFDYRLEANPAYTGQHGPLPFEDPFWKVILIVLAALLAVASLIYDYVAAGQDDKFIIGQIVRNGDAMANAVDCAVCSLNGSRGVDLGALDAQGDDVNNSLPIESLDGVIQLDRSDNGNFGIQDAVPLSVVWKSGGRSGTTRGLVGSIHGQTKIAYDTEDTISGEITFKEQVEVTQIEAMEQLLSQAGDSGSVWVDMGSRRPVALNFAGNKSDDGKRGIGNPIRAVVERLGIRFNP